MREEIDREMRNSQRAYKYGLARPRSIKRAMQKPENCRRMQTRPQRADGLSRDAHSTRPMRGSYAATPRVTSTVRCTSRASEAHGVVEEAFGKPTDRRKAAQAGVKRRNPWVFSIHSGLQA